MKSHAQRTHRVPFIRFSEGTRDGQAGNRRDQSAEARSAALAAAGGRRSARRTDAAPAGEDRSHASATPSSLPASPPPGRVVDDLRPPSGHAGTVETRLTVELVPSTCWYTNVRSNVEAAVWDRLRRRVAADAGQRCEICGGRGRRWPVECHEVWHYDDERHVQRLERLIALCPSCHEAKHAGLASKRGKLPAVIRHLARVNGWSEEDAGLYLEAAFEVWSQRSRYQWTLDITVLGERYGTDADPGGTAKGGE